LHAEESVQSELNQDELARHAERLKRRAANSREEIREINSALRPADSAGAPRGASHGRALRALPGAAREHVRD
jgi:hypothetical protein